VSGTPFSGDAFELGSDRLGRAVDLRVMASAQARELAEVFAQMDPWNRLGQSAQTIEGVLAGGEPGASSYLICVDQSPAGAVVVHAPWLLGAYLKFVGLLPDYQEGGVGACALRWIEDEARGAFGNLWVCTSAFNARAAEFYQANGFARIAVLEDLIVEGEDEILLRKRI